MFKFDSVGNPEVAMTGTQTGKTSKDNNYAVMVNFGIHREAPISAWNPQTIETFDKKGSGRYGNKEKLKRHFTKAADTLPQTKRRKENAVKASNSYDIELGVEHIERLLGESGNGGLNHIWEKGTIDKDLSPPAARAVYGIAVLDPRTIEIFGKRSSLATVRSRNGTKTGTEILHAWNDPTEDLQIFVANITAMSAGVTVTNAAEVA